MYVCTSVGLQTLKIILFIFHTDWLGDKPSITHMATGKFKLLNLGHFWIAHVQKNPNFFQKRDYFLLSHQNKMDKLNKEVPLEDLTTSIPIN